MSYFCFSRSVKPHGSHKSLADSSICCYFHHMMEGIFCGWRGSRVKSSQASVLVRTLDSECIRNVLIFLSPCILHTCIQHLDTMTFQCTSWHQSMQLNVGPVFNPASIGGHSRGVLTVLVFVVNLQPSLGSWGFGIRFSFSAPSQTPGRLPRTFLSTLPLSSECWSSSNSWPPLPRTQDQSEGPSRACSCLLLWC